MRHVVHANSQRRIHLVSELGSQVRDRFSGKELGDLPAWSIHGLPVYGVREEARRQDGWKVPLSKFLLATTAGLHRCKADGDKIDLESAWTVKNMTEQIAGEGEADAVDHVEELAEGFVTIDAPPQARPQLRSMLGAIITQLQRTNDQLQTINNRLDSMEGRLQAIDDCLDRPASQPMTSTIGAIADQLKDTGDQLQDSNDKLEGMNKGLAKLETHLQAIEDQPPESGWKTFHLPFS